MLPAPGQEASQHQAGIDPDHPLDDQDGRHRAPGLLLAQAEAALQLPVHHLDLPPLPGPGQQLPDRPRQDPGIVGTDLLEQPFLDAVQSFDHHAKVR